MLSLEEKIILNAHLQGLVYFFPQRKEFNESVERLRKMVNGQTEISSEIGDLAMKISITLAKGPSSAQTDSAISVLDRMIIRKRSVA